MKMITKNSDYAIRAVAYLARGAKKFVSSSQISRDEKIPLLYLRRILQELIKNGIVVSREGVSGGVRLARKPALVSVADIIRVVQGPIQLSECMFREKLCANRGRCVLRKKIQGIEEKVNQEFERISIADLLK